MCQLSLKYLFRLLSDFIIITILLVLSLNLSKLWGPTTRRGFFCGDESLMYPNRKNTITYPILFLIGLGIPVVVIIVGALLENFILNSRPTKNRVRFLITVNDTLLPFLFGFAAERLLKEIGKFTLGRLRPYFFAVCQPMRWDGTTCEYPENYNVYIEDYECMGNANGVDAHAKAFMEKIMRSSFPSGHTSLVCYGMLFTIYYLQRFAKCLSRYRASFGLFVPMLQLFCLLLAWFVAISRILDYKHHWSDVLAGGLLGASVAIAVAFYVDGQLRSVATFLEAMEFPIPPPRRRTQGFVGGDGTMSVVSTQVSDISRSGVGHNDDDCTNVQVQVHGP